MRTPDSAPKEELSIETASDRNGRFALEEFPPGANVLLWATAPGHTSTNKMVEVPQNETVLVLGPLGTLRGRVEDAEASAPIREFAIWLAGGSEERTFHSEEGSFEWQGLSPGRQKMAVQAPGYLRRTVEVDIHPGELTNAGVFRLRPGVELSGHIVDSESGEALADVVVGYKKTSGAEDRELLLSRATSQITDANGHFRFDNCRPRK